MTAAPRKFIAGAALLLAASGLAAGCGDDNAATTSRATPPPATAAGRIAYVEEGTGTPQLFTIRADGKARRQITHLDAGDAANPDWSRDGARLVYEASIGEHAGIFLATSEGLDAHDLTPKGFQGQPAFSPDGRTIAFEREAGGNGLALMRADGSHVRRLTRNPFGGGEDCGCDTDPNFSPDGRTITFVRIKRDEETAALFAIRPDGTHLRRLTPYSWNVAIKHDWSPDGKRIAISTQGRPGDDGGANLLTSAPDGSDARELTKFHGDQSAYVGSYSPDGTSIAFRLEHDGVFDLATMPSDGGPTKVIRRFKTAKPRFIDWGRGS
jgi:Tol biopolymer transport system component